MDRSPVDHVSLHALTLIVAVAEHSSFTAAAEASHLSQSALSRAVNATERRLDSQLFVRTTRSVTLTPEGRELVRLAEDLLASHRRSINEFELFRDGHRGSVRIATLPSAAATLVPPVVAALREERPGVSIAVEDTLAHIALDRLLAGEVDYALITDDWLPDDADFLPLTSDRFHVVARSDHPFGQRSAVSWRDFAAEPVALFGRSSSIRTRTDEVLDDLKLRPPSVTEAQNIAVVAGLVAAGLGVAAVPGLVVPLMRFADLVAVPLVEPEVVRPLGLVSIRDRPLSQAAAVFAEALQRHVGQSADG